MEIKILGMGCPKCRRLEELAREAVAELGIEATFTKVADMGAIMAYEVLSTPALVIGEAVKSSGRIPRKDEIAGWIRAARGLQSQRETITKPEDEEGRPAPCACVKGSFAALPPELRPRPGKSNSLRKVACPGCGLVYSTNRATDLCIECEKKGDTR